MKRWGSLPHLLGFLLCGQVMALEVPPAYQTVAEAEGVPPALLYAIALTESGTPLDGRRVRPWPWTLNVAGNGERYPSRLAAWRALKRYLASGITRVDVGFMQVNWAFHHHRLADPWRALDPWFNLATGARILKEEYTRTADWLTAAGRYHAGAPTTPARRRRAAAYRRKVAAWLQRISSATVRVGQPAPPGRR